MRRFHRSIAVQALVACALLGAGGARAQALANYTLTAPSWVAPEADVVPSLPLAAIGPVRLAGGGSATGSGLSLEAGEKWFARAGIGRSLENDVLSLGGGYRFAAGDALSMQVTRQLGQERLGLAVRYDYRQTYLRLSYEQPLRTPGAPDRLRFSAGIRF